MCFRVIAGRCLELQAVTQIAAGDERDRPLELFDGLPDAPAEPHVICIGKKAIAKSDDPSIPTVTWQKVERNRRAVIKIKSPDSDRLQILISSDARNLIQQFVVELSMHSCGRRAKVCKVRIQLRSIVGDKRVRLEWRVRRNH